MVKVASSDGLDFWRIWREHHLGGAKDGIIFDENRSFPQTVQAIFSPLPLNNDGNQVWLRLTCLLVDSSLSTDLNEIRINSVGGTVN